MRGSARRPTFVRCLAFARASPRSKYCLLFPLSTPAERTTTCIAWSSSWEGWRLCRRHGALCAWFCPFLFHHRLLRIYGITRPVYVHIPLRRPTTANERVCTCIPLASRSAQSSTAKLSNIMKCNMHFSHEVADLPLLKRRFAALGTQGVPRPATQLVSSNSGSAVDLSSARTLLHTDSPFISQKPPKSHFCHDLDAAMKHARKWPRDLISISPRARKGKRGRRM